ncbi:UNVERIFIED_CONTAM: hypothetical protein RMT77_008756 [Armadillidium vulgare]
MLKMKITVFLAVVICIVMISAEKISKEECEKRGGRYCLSAGMCYFSLNETVSTYKEASDLCAAKDATPPFLNIADYVNFIDCRGGFPFELPSTLFLLPFLHRADECVAITLMDADEFSVLNRCSLEGKGHVICEIKL